MKYFLSMMLVLASANASAAEGFTWLGGVSEKYNIPWHVVHFSLVAALVLLIGIVYRSKTASVSTAIVPDKGISFRNLVEFIGEFIYGLCRNIMGEERAKKYYTVIVFLFVFIFASNLIGLIPGFLPPTENFNTTLAMGVFVFIYYNIQGIRTVGFVNHIKHFMGPVWYMAILIFPIELISHAVRPLALGLRLKGNMQGDHMVLMIFSDLIPYLIPIPFYVLGIFVCFMQAFVFTLLSMVYINLSTESHDHGDEAHH